MKTVTVGLVDSGLPPGLEPKCRAAAGFRQEEGGVRQAAAMPDVLGHGSEVAAIIAEQAPGVVFANAQVFFDRLITSPAAVAAALLWLMDAGARLITVSAGVRADRPVLAAAVAAAQAHGVILLAASPARGGPVFPAQYPGVIRIMGDNRCGPGVFSHLNIAEADFGACGWPRGVDAGGRPILGGASFAAAYAAGAVAKYLSCHPDADSEAVRRHLTNLAAIIGREVVTRPA